MPAIAVITTPHWSDLLILGGLIVGFFWMGYLGTKLICLWLDGMRLVQHGKRSLEEATRPSEYADFDADPADDMTEHFDDARQLAATGREIAPEDEPSWPGKAPLVVEPINDNPTRYATGGLIAAPGPVLVDESGCSLALPIHGVLPETAAEISHPRHSADDTETGLIPVVVDGEAAMDAVAAVVSGQDGAP